MSWRKRGDCAAGKEVEREGKRERHAQNGRGERK